MKNRFEYKSSSNNPMITVIMVIFAIFVIFALFRLAAFVTQILGIIAPILLIATLIIDYKVIVNYVKMIINLLKRNVLLGIGASVLSVLGIPFVAVFLFSKAMLNRKVKNINDKIRREEEGEPISFEELVNDEAATTKKEVEILELEEPEKRKSNEYETLFEDAEIEDENPSKDNNEKLWD